MAFDRIYCQSDLKGWIITLTDTTQSAVLTPYNQNATLTEQLSQKLILKDTNANTVITIFPWNSLYIRIANSTKKNFKIDSKESAEGFQVEIIDKSTKVSRSLNCSFTF
jgi:hypothetical protein